jgi:hypothetical protein
LTHSESNSLRRELARSQPETSHPEPNLLNGFAEGMLLAREREAIVDHLAGCAECREVVSLAVDSVAPEAAKAEVIAISLRPRSVFRVWLPVGAAAAGIVIASAIAFRYVRMGALSHATTVSRQTEPLGASRPEPPVVQVPQTAQSAHPAVKSPPGSNQHRPESEPPRATMEAAPPMETAEASNHTDAGNRPAATLDKSIASEPRVPAFANTVTTHALASEASSVARPHWRINGQGQIERAFGNEPWQAVLGGDGKKMRVLSVTGAEVWAGGDNSRVYRSTDNGQTWAAVSLPEKNGADHAIAHIRLESPQEIRIEATDGTTWNSTDGGATWR